MSSYTLELVLFQPLTAMRKRLTPRPVGPALWVQWRGARKRRMRARRRCQSGSWHCDAASPCCSCSSSSPPECWSLRCSPDCSSNTSSWKYLCAMYAQLPIAPLSGPPLMNGRLASTRRWYLPQYVVDVQAALTILSVKSCRYYWEETASPLVPSSAICAVLPRLQSSRPIIVPRWSESSCRSRTVNYWVFTCSVISLPFKNLCTKVKCWRWTSSNPLGLNNSFPVNTAHLRDCL